MVFILFQKVGVIKFSVEKWLLTDSYFFVEAA